MIKKLILIEIIILSFQVVTYFGCELLQHNPHNVKCAIDDRVPLRPAWVYVYVMWFPLIFFYPFLLFFCSERYYIIYTVAILADIVISTIAYVMYPTSFERKTPKSGFFGDSLKFIYFFSFKGYNCAPSMHCSMCFITIWTILCCPAVPLFIRGGVVLLALAIIAATQLTKQHVVMDVTTAIPTAAISLAFGYGMNNELGTQVLLSLLGL